MDSCLAESLEIVQSLDRKRDFNSEFKANLKELKSTRKFKKNKKEQIERLKEKHGLNQKYSNKVKKIEKFDAAKKREKSIKQLKKTDVKSDLEKWCKLTGSSYLKKEKEEKEEEEESTLFDDKYFEEFSKDFLGVPEKR